MNPAQIKGQVDAVIRDISKFIIGTMHQGDLLDEIMGGIMVIGLSDSNQSSVSGASQVIENAKTANDDARAAAFRMRDALHIYRDGL